MPRLFIALDLPSPVRAELAAVQGRLRRGNLPVRWSDAAGMHLTLQFLGDIGAELVEPLLDGLRSVEVAPPTLSLMGLGAFPSLGQPRVIWAGLGGDSIGLAALQRAVLAATAVLGFVPETRPFSPHLTLGRSSPGISPDERARLAEIVATAIPPAPLEWQAERPLLYQSILTTHGPIYRLLGPGLDRGPADLVDS